MNHDHERLPFRGFSSWDDYWSVRHDETLWMPFFREALALAGVTPAQIIIQRPSQYPTARSGDVVVTVYPDASIAGNTFDLEVEAHALIAGHGLPFPTVVATGEFSHDSGQPVWHWLVESAATGLPWNQLRSQIDPRKTHRAAKDVGAALRKLHALPHSSGTMLGPHWGRFRELIEDEAKNLGTNDDRLRSFPDRFLPALRGLSTATLAEVNPGASTSLLHGDVHGDNVFVSPGSGQLTAIIDLNEMYAGHPWYDLADACFRLLRGDRQLTVNLLRGYGVPEPNDERIAIRLLGWGLLHDFDGLTATVHERGIPQSAGSISELARHMIGLD